MHTDLEDFTPIQKTSKRLIDFQLTVREVKSEINQVPGRSEAKSHILIGLRV